jgi:tetratricopeptide (TPR) repeat protein
MNNNSQMETILDDLLKNKITRNEAEILLEKETVADIAMEIDLHICAASALQRYSVLKMVQSVHQTYATASPLISMPTKEDKKVSAIKMINPVKWAISAAAIIIVVVSSWFTYQYVNTSSSKLYSQIYQPYSLNTDRGMADISTHNMIEDFKNKNFSGVIKTYESLPSPNTRERFLSAYAYHEKGNYQKAIELLNQILENNKLTNTRLYNDEAEFYTGLSYLKINKPESAIPFFEKIRNNPNHTFYERITKSMIKRLKWLK